MCDPVSIAVTATAIMAGSSIYQGYTQRKEASYSAKISRNNATIQDRLAEDAIVRGDKREALMRRKIAAFAGSQRAALAASGVNVDTGSASLLAADTLAQGELDALSIRDAAEREAWGYRSRAENYRTQSELTKMAGRNAQRATILSGFGNALSVGSGVYGGLKAPGSPGGSAGASIGGGVGGY